MNAAQSYQALAYEMDADPLSFPKSMKRVDKLKYIASRLERNAENMKKIAILFAKLSPPPRFRLLHTKTRRFLDLNASQLLELAQRVRVSVANGKQRSNDLAEGLEEQTLMAALRDVKQEALRSGLTRRTF